MTILLHPRGVPIYWNQVRLFVYCTLRKRQLGQIFLKYQSAIWNLDTVAQQRFN